MQYFTSNNGDLESPSGSYFRIYIYILKYDRLDDCKSPLFELISKIPLFLEI